MKFAPCGEVLAAALVAAAFSHAALADVTFKVCKDQVPAFKRNGDSVEVRCPGNPVPAMVVWGCVDARVTRIGTDYTLHCSRWNRYDVKPSQPSP